jgi:hypothetical protein
MQMVLLDLDLVLMEELEHFHQHQQHTQEEAAVDLDTQDVMELQE